MTQLSRTEQDLLLACARIMSKRGEGGSVNLFPLNGSFKAHRPQMLEFLRAQVERISGGRLSVRPADRELFLLHGNPPLYVAVCPFGTEEGTITRLTQGITLYQLSPSANGFNRGSGADALDIVWAGATTAQRNAIATFMGAFQTALYGTAEYLVKNSHSPELRDEAAAYLRGGAEEFTPEKAACICGVLALGPHEFFERFQRTFRE